MRKILITIILLQISIFAVNAQALKTYSGPYSISKSTFGSGKANYTYYTKDGEEIKKGRFKFSVSAKNYAGSMSINISGTYADNLKTGLWTYTIKVISRKVGGNTNFTLKANYAKGLPNGLWKYTLSGANNTASGNITANFKMGTLIKDFVYTGKDNTKITNYKAKLDNNGYFISESQRTNQNERIYEYHKKVLITDEYPIEKIDEILLVYKKFANQPDSLKDYKYVLTEKNGSFPEQTYDMFFNFLYLYDDITGDVNYVSTDYRNNVKYKYDGFRYYTISTQKTTSEYYNEKIVAADEYFEKQEYYRAINYYYEALEYKKETYAENKIKEAERKIDDNYQKIINEADTYFKDYNFNAAKQSYQNAQKVKNDNGYCQSRINLINDMRNGNKYLKKAVNFANNNQLDSAIHYYKIVDYFHPNNPQILNSLGWSYLMNKNFNEALSIFEKAETDTRKSDKMYYYILGNLAHSYLLTGNTEKATEIYYANLGIQINNKNWSDMVVDDFNEFLKKGITNDNYETIAKKLKRKKKWKAIQNNINQ